MPLRIMRRTRAAVVTLAAVAGALAVTATIASVHAPSASAAVADAGGPPDRWLKALDGKHRQFFDAPSPAGGIPLVHVMNYYDTYNKAYGVKDADIDAVLTFYGGTTFYGLSDDAWAKYRLGEFLEVTDPATGKPATRNPWRTAPVVLGMTLPSAGIEALQLRGASMILCNNALQIFSGLLAAKRGLNADTVYQDLRKEILPGVELVPGMVIAVEQARFAGMSYHRQ
jgi:hypothetical protein